MFFARPETTHEEALRDNDIWQEDIHTIEKNTYKDEVSQNNNNYCNDFESYVNIVI